MTAGGNQAGGGKSLVKHCKCITEVKHAFKDALEVNVEGP